MQGSTTAMGFINFTLENFYELITKWKFTQIRL